MSSSDHQTPSPPPAEEESKKQEVPSLAAEAVLVESESMPEDAIQVRQCPHPDFKLVRSFISYSLFFPLLSWIPPDPWL